MKQISLVMLVFLMGCAAESTEAKAGPEVYGRYVCSIPAERTSSTEFKTPWVKKDDVFTGSKCLNGVAICWWANTPIQFNKTSRHQHFYVPVPGSTCHYETAGGKKPNDWD